MIPKSVIFLIFLSFCSPINSYSYNITSDNNSNLETRLTINIRQSFDGTYNLDIQAFPNKSENIQNYKLVFDMTFREDYESDFNDICIGPSWNEKGSGELELNLAKSNNFKMSLKGNDSYENDRCNKYFYYIRYLIINLANQQQIYVGTATNYGGNYPDAPNYWIVNKNNEIEKIGSTNIKKYSLNFELSK